MLWNHDQVTVHSGITKYDGDKYYYTHLSEGRTHDHVFADDVLTQMVGDALQKGKILINSDNFSSQYKCIQLFAKLQNLADKSDATVIQICSIASHGKGEVDHAGGLSKVTIRRTIAGDQLIKQTDQMVEYLESKYSEKIYPRYRFRDISPKFLEDKKMEDLLKKYNTKKYNTIDGSSRFQVVMFHLGKTTFRPARHLCICDQCIENEYGSCSEFE